MKTPRCILCGRFMKKEDQFLSLNFDKYQIHRDCFHGKAMQYICSKTALSEEELNIQDQKYRDISIGTKEVRLCDSSYQKVENC